MINLIIYYSCKVLFKLRLFNIKDDPKELNDLSSNYPGVVKKLESFMKSAHSKTTIEKFNIPVLDQY